jgi:hypothetical protein
MVYCVKNTGQSQMYEQAGTEKMVVIRNGLKESEDSLFSYVVSFVKTSVQWNGKKL